MLRQLVVVGATSAPTLEADSDFDGARDWLAWVFANGQDGTNEQPAPAVASLPGCLTALRSAPGSFAALAASVLAP